MSMTIGGESGFHGIGPKIDKKPGKLNPSNVSKTEKKEDAKSLNMDGSEKKEDFNNVIGELFKSDTKRDNSKMTRVGSSSTQRGSGGGVGGGGRHGGARGTLA